MAMAELYRCYCEHGPGEPEGTYTKLVPTLQHASLGEDAFGVLYVVHCERWTADGQRWSALDPAVCLPLPEPAFLIGLLPALVLVGALARWRRREAGHAPAGG